MAKFYENQTKYFEINACKKAFQFYLIQKRKIKIQKKNNAIVASETFIYVMLFINLKHKFIQKKINIQKLIGKFKINQQTKLRI